MPSSRLPDCVPTAKVTSVPDVGADPRAEFSVILLPLTDLMVAELPSMVTPWLAPKSAPSQTTSKLVAVGAGLAATATANTGVGVNGNRRVWLTVVPEDGTDPRELVRVT